MVKTSPQGQLRFKCPSEYDGTPEKFVEFAFKFKSYLNLSHPRFGPLMTDAENTTHIVVDEALVDPVS